MFEKIINFTKKHLRFFINILKRTKNPKNSVFSAHKISCKQDAIKMISSSSVVLHIKTTEVDVYFFECRKHTNIKKYVKSFVDDYFQLYCDDNPQRDSDREFILKSIKKNKKLQKVHIYGYQAV